jgi:hypothetical protein
MPERKTKFLGHEIAVRVVRTSNNVTLYIDGNVADSGPIRSGIAVARGAISEDGVNHIVDVRMKWRGLVRKPIILVDDERIA